MHHYHRALWPIALILATFLAFVHPNRANAIIKNDYDGDSKSDLAVWRPSDGTWYVIPSSGTCPPYMEEFYGYACKRQWGLPGDTPILGDYDGLDDRNDYAVFRPSNLYWYLRYSAINATFVMQFGLQGDRPTRGDFEGDAKTDIAIFRPLYRIWCIRWSSDLQNYVYDDHVWVPEHLVSMTPVPAYFDSSTRVNRVLYIKYITNGRNAVAWAKTELQGGGVSYRTQYASHSDIPLAGNYTGDYRADYSRWESSTGNWIIGITNPTVIQWGLAGDIPVVGDYDGDGRDDPTVFRPQYGIWFVKPSTTHCPSGMTEISGGCQRQWGLNGDIPLGSVPSY